MVLFFQPAYSPELNPIERVWQWNQSQLSWKIFPDLEDRQNKVAEILKNATKEVLASITGWDALTASLESAGF